jgi:hypothetical protein
VRFERTTLTLTPTAVGLQRRRHSVAPRGLLRSVVTGCECFTIELRALWVFDEEMGDNEVDIGES